MFSYIQWRHQKVNCLRCSIVRNIHMRDEKYPWNFPHSITSIISNQLPHFFIINYFTHLRTFLVFHMKISTSQSSEPFINNILKYGTHYKDISFCSFAVFIISGNEREWNVQNVLHFLPISAFNVILFKFQTTHPIVRPF